jgi:MIP family channel proteins
VVAEAVGALALMFVGGAAILNGSDLLHVAMAHGLILAVTVTALMHISGGQFNPAVSVALAVIGRQPWGRALAFAAAQLAGAALGAFLLSRAFSAGQVEAGRLGATLGSLSLAGNTGMVLVLEAVATFFLMLVILGSAVDQRGVGQGAKVGGFAIGLTVSANILAIGPLTGASMNPSRSFGPALVGGYWDMHWAYWAAPIAGAVAAALVWSLLLGGGKPEGRAG